MLKIVVRGRKSSIRNAIIDMSHYYAEKPEGYHIWVEDDDVAAAKEALRGHGLEFFTEKKTDLGTQVYAEVRSEIMGHFYGEFTILSGGRLLESHDESANILRYLHTLTFANV